MIDQNRIENAVKEILIAIGEDPNREGIIETPKRVAKAYAEIFAGKDMDAAEPLSKTFPTDSKSYVIQRDIEFHSMCEHHLLPFFGKVHICYLPEDEVVGLSKLARTVEVFARRVQLQEQLTDQIANALFEQLNCRGAIVMIEASHMCMSMRGIQKPGAITTTVSSNGEFEVNQSLRQEVMTLLKG